MKAKNNSLRYFYLVLGCVGIIGILAISIPNIYRHHRNAEILGNAINVNLTQVATYQRKLMLQASTKSATLISNPLAVTA